jgi:hypothetical protein
VFEVDLEPVVADALPVAVGAVARRAGRTDAAGDDQAMSGLTLAETVPRDAVPDLEALGLAVAELELDVVGVPVVAGRAFEVACPHVAHRHGVQGNQAGGVVGDANMPRPGPCRGSVRASALSGAGST